jgi:hypothetical protein
VPSSPVSPSEKPSTRRLEAGHRRAEDGWPGGALLVLHSLCVEMHISPSAKFAAFFLSRCAASDDMPHEPEETDSVEGVWVGQQLSIEAASHWREWLGSLTFDEMKEDGLAVYVTAPAEHPEILDGENQALLQRVNDILHGLALQGPVDQSVELVVEARGLYGRS